MCMDPSLRHTVVLSNSMYNFFLSLVFLQRKYSMKYFFMSGFASRLNQLVIKSKQHIRC